MKYSPFEQQAALDAMTVLVDSREQPTESFDRRVQHFPRWRRQKLDAGDYGCELNIGGELIRLPVAVERKMSLDELCQCFGKERKRFQREFDRAHKSGVKLHLLVEDANWEMAYSGDYRSKLPPQSLVGSLLAWEERYGMTIHFCAPETTGTHIQKILYYAAREWLDGQK